MKQGLLFILFVTLLIGLSVVGGTGCANIIPPSGGPADSAAPLLIKSSPNDSSLNFRGARIELTFDEYIEVQNAQQELLVSPVPRIQPVVDYRLNTVTVRLRDTLEANTTYTINFGNAIKDVNEGNPARNLTYTFSTGTYFDSLEFRGNVILAETGGVDTSLIVMLHSNPNDSAVIKDKPRYVSKLDGRGRFVFRNLPPRTYSVYALKDETNTLRYFDDKQLFAFANERVTIGDSTRSVTLYAYSVRPPSPVSTAPAAVSKRGNNQAQDRRLRYTNNLLNQQQDLLGNFELNFEQPLRSFDSTRVSLRKDTTFTPVTDYRFSKDSNNRKAVLTTSWQQNTTYHLILDKDFAEDSLGRKLLKNDTLTFTTKKLSDYGELKLRIRNLDVSRNPVLQFVMNGNVTRSFPLTGIDFSQQVFFPGDYELRILFDDNRNGKWDPGDFFGSRRQPERVIPIERRISVKPNWENEFEINF